MAFGKMLKRSAEPAEDVRAPLAGTNAIVPVYTSADKAEILGAVETADMDWFWRSDRAGHLTYLSPNAARFLHARLDKDAPEIVGMPLARFFAYQAAPGDGGSSRPLSFLLNTHGTLNEMTVQIASERSGIWWSVMGRPQKDKGGEFDGYIGTCKDITDAYENHCDASRMAEYDTLTGLANRHRMEKRLTATLTALKAAKRSFALFMLDLDRFKHVNDTLGHPAGDELLKQVGQRLERIIGDRGEIGRIGGDEFQIILPDREDRGELGDLANTLIQMISQPYSIDGSRAIIGTSIGIAIAPYDGVESDELVSSTDLALYAAKGGGRGQFRFYSSDLKQEANLRREIEEDLRDALTREEIHLHYQPLVNAKTHEVECFEALIRWNHAERGPISPGLFIPIAEETKLIFDIGEWALERACHDAMEWPNNIKVAVNLSAVQFASDDLIGIVERALEQSGLPAGRLELEITENVFMGDPLDTEKNFAALKKLGVRLALDDFGTGYSSLGYLRHAPLDKIKIDQSFVRGCTEGGNNAAIISAVVNLADALGMETVAEGVEALDQLELVTKRGAHLIQGYIFSRPISHEDVCARFADGELKFRPCGPKRARSSRRTVYQRIGAIHEDHRYNVVLRNISTTGARIEGLLNVPLATQLVLDLGGGQLAVGAVRQTDETSQGIEFEQRLVEDGAGGLCTRHRVSPYALAAAGMPLAALPDGYSSYMERPREDMSSLSPKFVEIQVGG